jgi:hypothetical protein
MVDKWIGPALRNKRKGATHRQLHVPQDEKLPLPLLERIRKTPLGKKISYTVDGKRWRVTVTPLLKKRAVLAGTLKKIGIKHNKK